VHSVTGIHAPSYTSEPARRAVGKLAWAARPEKDLEWDGSERDHATTVKPRYTVQPGSRGFERYTVWKRYIASSLINRCKGLK
jgi:hypothetical protein